MRLAVRPPARPLALAGLLASLVLMYPDARAVTLDWAAAINGTAGTAARWNPAQVPTAIDDLRFDVAGAYTVTFGGTVPASSELSVRDGSPRFQFASPHTTGRFEVGTAGGLAPVARVGFGQLTFTGPLVLGEILGADGTLEIAGSTTDVVGTAAIAFLNIGSAGGTGALSILDGGSFTSDGPLSIPASSGGTGTLLIQGGDAVRRSTLALANPSSIYPMWIGRAGVGTVDVLDGGLLAIERSMFLGENPTATGTLTVRGAGPHDSSRVTITNDLWIARNGGAAAAGTGTVTVADSGVIEVAGATYTYDDQPGGQGLLQIDAGGRFATHDLHLGEPAAELALLGGTLQITGGVLNATGDPLRIGGTADNPMLQLLAGSTCELNSATIPALEVGTGGQAELQVLDGSSLIVHDRLARLGANAGSYGTMLVSGGSTLVTDDDLIVGRAGTGTLMINGGSQATLGGLNLATQASGGGSGFISGAGTDVHVTGNLVISGLVSGGSGATSALFVTEGARVWLDGALSAGDGTVWPSGTLGLMTDGELRMTDRTTLNVKGQLLLAGGLVRGGVVDLRDGGRVSGSGEVDAPVWDGVDTLARVIATGPLTLGDPTDPLGYVMRGRLDVGGQTVTLRDADSASVGAVSIAGGTLQGPDGGIHIESAGYLVGIGTVLGKVRNQGAILPSTLSFGGALASEGAVIRGGTVRFLSGGSFRGRGTIEALFQVDAGATALVTGATTFNSLLTVNGHFDANGQSVTIGPASTAQVSGELALSNGSLVSPIGGVVLITTGRLSGSGIVVGPLLVNGRVEPGPGIGILTVSSLGMNTPGALEIELGDRATGACDRIVVTGTATLAGRLDLRLASTYDAVPGDSFLVLTAASIVGAFDEIALANAPVVGKAAVHVNGGQVWVVIENGLADVPGGPIASAAPGTLAFAPLGSPGRAVAFELALPEASAVRIEVFDVGGRRVARLADGALAAGRHRFAVPRDAAGLLYARAEIAGATTRRTVTARAVMLR